MPVFCLLFSSLKTELAMDISTRGLTEMIAGRAELLIDQVVPLHLHVKHKVIQQVQVT